MYQFEFKFLDNARQFTANLEAQFAKINNITKQTQDKVADIGKPFNVLNAGFGRIGAMVAGAFAVNEVVQFGRESVNVFNDLNKNAELLKMKLGGVETPKVLQELEQFADKMGMSIPAVQDTYLSLVNRGFKPTMDQMRQLSDVAVISKKPVDQLMEALLDAEMNEYERLKEFGVKFSTNGNKIITTYQGVTKSIDNNAQSVREYLLGLGDTEGIRGASEKLGQGLAGNMQRLENSMTKLKNSFGEILAPVLNFALPKLGEGLERIRDFLAQNQDKFKVFFDPLIKIGTSVFNTLQPIFDVVGKLGLGAMNVLSEQWNRFGDMLQRQQSNIDKISKAFAWIGDIIVTIAVPAFDILGRVFTHITESIISDIGAIIGDIQSMYDWVNNLFSGMWNFASNFFNNMVKGIDELFPGFKNAFQQVKDWIYNTFFKPISDWFGNLFKNIFKIDYENLYRSEGGSGQSIYDPNNKTKSPINAGNLGLSDRLKQNTASVSGGQNIKHITININKLVESQQFNTVTIPQSKEEVKRLMTEILMSVVNDANYAT